MNPRLAEIRNEIDACVKQITDLHSKAWEIVQTMPEDTSAPPELTFDAESRTVRWFGGSVRLSRNQYRLIHTLWQGENHEATLETIETMVWTDAGPESRLFVTKHAILTQINRARTQVRNAEFPYGIETIKTDSTKETKGYRLVFPKRT
jgi:DNA-binding response OmpR family regulator